MILRPPSPPQDFNFPFMPVPVIQAAINQVIAITQAPPGLVLICALSAAAIACQPLADVELPIGSIRPLSTMSVLSADSGERKSVVFNYFFGPIRDLENRLEAEFKTQFDEYEERRKIWSIKTGAIEKNIRRLTIKGESTKVAEQELRQFLREKPEPPRKVKIIYEDTTSQALFLGLHQDFPFAGFCSSEGLSILNSSAFNDFAKQNAIWSGDPVTIDRVSAPSFRLSNNRLTVLIMLQPSAIEAFQESRGEETRGSGLWARFIVCQPGSTQGTRFITNGTTSSEHIKLFQDRVTELLEEGIKAHNTTPNTRIVLKFSEEAATRWLECFNWVESQMAPGGRYFQARDHASKLMENVGRVAGILHVFERFDGPISLSTLNTAITICDYSSADFMNMFVPLPQEELDATLLLSYLNRCRGLGHTNLRKNYVRNYGPNLLRKNTERFNHALNLLCFRGNISLNVVGKTTYISLYPLPYPFTPQPFYSNP